MITKKREKKQLRLQSQGLSPAENKVDYDPSTATLNPVKPPKVNIPDSPTINLSPRNPSAPLPVAPTGEGEYNTTPTPEVGPAPEPWKMTKRPPRWKGFLQGFLSAAGEGANRALASGNVGWGGVAQALGGGLGGGAAVAADPSIIQKARYNQAVANNQAEQERQYGNQMREAQIGDLNAKTEGRTALADARERGLGLQERGLDLREQAQNTRAEYMARSADLREKALNQQISFADWKKQQAELDRAFKQSEGQLNRQNRIDVANIRANSDPAVTESTQNEIDAQAAAIQKQIDQIVESQKGKDTREPIYDKTTGAIVGYQEGTVNAEYKQGQERIKTLEAQKDRLFAESRKSKLKLQPRQPIVTKPKFSEGYIRRQAKLAGLTPAEIEEAVRINAQQ